MIANFPTTISGLQPYVQLILLAGLTWILRELVVHQGAEHIERARSLLLERLEKAYGPLYLVVGEILYQLECGGDVTSVSRQDLREILKTHGHHLRPEHYTFCVDLLSGRRPSPTEIFWHRHSVYTELEKLRHLLYGASSELEAALTVQPLAVLWRWLARVVEYIVAAGVWVVVFLLMAWIVFRWSGGAGRWLMPVGLVILGLWVLRELVAIVSFRRRFSASVLKGVKRGDRGQSVRLVQLMLQVLGYHLGWYGLDGVFGHDTEDALRNFQIANGLKPTGKVDRRTRLRLYAATRGL